MEPKPRRRVLVVDDEPPVAAMLTDVLTTWGYAVQVAATGADAISVVPEFRPDLVLLDMALPGIPGELVLDCLRASDAHVPIIMMTGNNDRDAEVALRARGASDYIAKPFNLNRLRQMLDAALSFRA